MSSNHSCLPAIVVLSAFVIAGCSKDADSSNSDSDGRTASRNERDRADGEHGGEGQGGPDGGDDGRHGKQGEPVLHDEIELGQTDCLSRANGMSPSTIITADEINQGVEERLVGVEVDSPDLLPKLKQWIVKQADVTGQWDSSHWHDGVHLTIEKHPDGRYGVVYHARGDLASWTLKRTAHFQDGVLEFDKPVEEYTPHEPYKRFYLLRVNNSLRFVSHPVAEEWLIDKAPKDWNSVVVDGAMLQRTRTKPTDAPDNK